MIQTHLKTAAFQQIPILNVLKRLLINLLLPDQFLKMIKSKKSKLNQNHLQGKVIDSIVITIITKRKGKAIKANNNRLKPEVLINLKEGVTKKEHQPQKEVLLLIQLFKHQFLPFSMINLKNQRN